MCEVWREAESLHKSNRKPPRLPRRQIRSCLIVLVVHFFVHLRYSCKIEVMCAAFQGLALLDQPIRCWGYFKCAAVVEPSNAPPVFSFYIFFFKDQVF